MANNRTNNTADGRAARVWYIENPDVPLTIEEQAIKDRHYQFVSTTNLGPGGVLGIHTHHSENIHHIVNGEITLWKYTGETTFIREEGRVTVEPRFRLRSGRVRVAADENNEITLDPLVWYEATAGPSGCVFVEGHRLLSPDTAKRFSDYPRNNLLKEFPKGVPVTEHTKGAITPTCGDI